MSESRKTAPAASDASVQRFVDELRELDADLASRGLDTATDARLRARLFDEDSIDDSIATTGRRRSWLPIGLAAAVGAACALVALLLWPREVSHTRPPQVGGFAVLAGRLEVETGSGVRCGTTTCRLHDDALKLDLTLQPRTRLARRDGGLALLDGRGIFEVRRRTAGMRTLAIYVARGRIEVRGTRFAVWQQARGGASKDAPGGVTLERGRIRYIDDGGWYEDLVAGQSLRWPARQPQAATPPTRQPASRRPASRATVKPARPVTKRATATRPGGLDARELLAAVERWRAAGRYDEAARQIRRALPRLRAGSGRERLSFELATLLGDQLRRRREACKQAAAHQTRYPRGRYQRELATARSRWRCQEP